MLQSCFCFFIHYTSVQVKANEKFSFPEREFFVCAILRLIRCEYEFILVHLFLKTIQAKIITSSFELASFDIQIVWLLIQYKKNWLANNTFGSLTKTNWWKKITSTMIRTFFQFNYVVYFIWKFLAFTTTWRQSRIERELIIKRGEERVKTGGSSL